MNKTLVISPSGNLYGSERVLLDYLQYTRQQFDVVLPAHSAFAALVAKTLRGHQLLYFNTGRLKIFYARLWIQLLLGKYKTIYINEAGHNKYILLLARFFPSKRFVIHVRIAEDTDPSRWVSFSGSNTHLVSISKTIQKKLLPPSRLLYDLYLFSTTEREPAALAGPVFNIGIIGRVAFSKGLAELGELIDYLNENNRGVAYQFKLFGEVPSELTKHPVIEKLRKNSSVSFIGFVADKKNIYSNIDVVLHLSKTEPLGRIFLEAIDEGKPLIGFNSAGIAEIGYLTGLNELLCDPLDENFPETIFSKLEATRNHYLEYTSQVTAKKKIAATVFSPAKYTEQLDNILLG